jgi:hypothetical protein
MPAATASPAWMALTRDDDAMLALCSLNVEIRLGSDPF